MNTSHTRRAVLFALVGVAGLLLKRGYHGPHAVLVTSYLGNLSVSFAVYFLAAIAAGRVGQGRLLAAAFALGVVEAFELSNGFGVMSNTYDPWDLIANAVGIAIGLGLDSAMGLRKGQVKKGPP